ncbi:MAG TPA: vanadium-dependent haloperoxidase [Acidimicrobiales bacterium]
MKRKMITLAALGTALIAAGAFAAPGPANGDTTTSANFNADRGGPLAAFKPGSGQIAVDWNKELLRIELTPGAQPATIHPTRSFALLNTAVYDAVVSITRADNPYQFSVVAPHSARPDAAADQAAHDTLLALFPSFAPELNQLLATQLAAIPESAAKHSGIVVGSRAATILLALRANDGSATAPNPFVPSNPPQPGGYQLTPPNFAPAVFTNWGTITPWVLEAGNRFRPPSPPPLTSPQWADAINQVQSLGQNTSTTRTPDETTIAKFWAPPIWNTWNEIADNQITENRTSLEESSHLLADLNLTFADSAIAFYDAKYHYQLWRPVTAIRAGTPGNPAVDPANTTWLPQAGNTAADPSYPAAHSTISGAAATVLSAFFGPDRPVTVSSDALAGVTRNFAGFQAAADEAGMSRIFAGQHTSIDVNAGSALGQQVAQFVLDQPFGANVRR